MRIETRLNIQAGFIEFLAQIDLWDGHNELTVWHHYADEIWVYTDTDGFAPYFLRKAGEVPGFLGISKDYTGRAGLLFRREVA